MIWMEDLRLRISTTVESDVLKRINEFGKEIKNQTELLD